MSDYKKAKPDYVEKVVEDPRIESELEKYHVLKTQLEELEKQKKQYRAEIIDKLQKYSEATNHFGDVVTRLSARKGSATVEWKDLLEEIIFTASDSQRKVIEALQAENKSTTKPYDKLEVDMVLDEALNSTHVLRTLLSDGETEAILEEETEVIQNLTDTVIDLGIEEGEFDEAEFYYEEPIALAASKFNKSSLREDWVKNNPKPAKKTVQSSDPEIEALVSKMMNLDDQIAELKELIKDQKTVCAVKLKEYDNVVTQFGKYIAVYNDFPNGVTKTAHSKVVKTYLEQVTESERRVIESVKEKMTTTKPGGHNLAYNMFLPESLDFGGDITADEIQLEIDIVTEINNKMFDLNNDIDVNYSMMPLAASEFYDDSIESKNFDEEDKETLIEEGKPESDKYFLLTDDIYYGIEDEEGLQVNLWTLEGKDVNGDLIFKNVDKPEVIITASINDVDLYKG